MARPTEAQHTRSHLRLPRHAPNARYDIVLAHGSQERINSADICWFDIEPGQVQRVFNNPFLIACVEDAQSIGFQCHSKKDRYFFLDRLSMFEQLGYVTFERRTK